MHNSKHFRLLLGRIIVETEQLSIDRPSEYSVYTLDELPFDINHEQLVFQF
jgi:hypothetical protein